MKILVLNYEYPPVGGGAGVISKHISEGLAKHGNDIHVVTVKHGELPKETIDNGVKVTRLSSKRKYLWQSNPREMLSWMRKAKVFLRKHLKTTKYDVCFAHFALPGGEVAYSMNLEFGLPYVIMSHGHDIPWFFPKQMWLYHTVTYFWIRKIVWNAKALFVQSEAMQKNAELFLGNVGKGKVIQIPNGWDAKFYYPSDTKNKKPFNLVFPGRLVKQKDPFTLINAMKILSQEIPEISLEIYGDGPLRPALEKFVKGENLSKFVHFHGWVDKSAMRQAYQNAALVVLPSLNEGMSMATLEAMACGAYVVVTDVSRNTLLVDEGVNGNIVPMQNVNQLVETIRQYYNEKYLQGYTVPLDTIKQLDAIYAWDAVVQQYNKMLREIRLT